MFWDVSYEDIKTSVKLYIGEQQARITQDYQTLSKVVSNVFGGGEKELPPEPKTKAELKSRFERLMSTK